MSDPATLLIADDDPGLRQSLERTLTREGYRVILASDGNAALERLQAGGVDLVLTDLKMPGLSGIELLRAVKAIASEVDVILLTAFGTVEEAVKAMKEGAYDFLTKPFQRAQLLRLIRQALERRDLIEQNRALQQRLDDLLQQGAVIGSSPAFRRTMALVEQVADSSATVLIQGESGTGKELVARTIHARSARSRGPLVAVNCAALPETLLESELFGYEKGAFTGAAGRKEGRTGERALLVAEQLRLEQRLGQRGAVDRDERTAAPRRARVDRARDELLARAALALDEHRGGAVCDLLDERHGSAEGGAGADDRALLEQVVEPLLERTVLLDQ